MSRYEILQYGNPSIPPHIQEDIESVLEELRITKSHILEGGGGLSRISKAIQDAFKKRGWTVEHRFAGATYKIDCIKDRVALDIEWNNKDTFFDRDCASFRSLFESGLIDCAVIITRSTILQAVFKQMVKSDGLSKDKFVSTTTHIKNLKKRFDNGLPGLCPVVAYGIQDIEDDIPTSHYSDEFFTF